MISVEEATQRITEAFRPVEAERVRFEEAEGRVLASDAIARADQPPSPVSSMDGYAVRAADATRAGTRLKVVGHAPAGHPFSGRIEAGQAVRIFTGGVVPEGADSIVIQEDTTADGDDVVLNASAVFSRHIRPAGLDFKRGEALVAAGRRLTARDLALLAAADVTEVQARRKPRVVFVATGDELSRPGEARKPGGIVASSGYGLSGLIRRWGGEPVDLGILPDTIEAISGIAGKSRGADIVVTLGGASVGDHDLVQRALGPSGFALDFWKIAMRPGKPLIFGRLGAVPLLGLPGNPVSTLVCALLFLRPAIHALLGAREPAAASRARLAKPLPANDARQDYIRASLSLRDGEAWAEPFAIQDSSMLSVLARADCLIVRKPNAPAAQVGEHVAFLPLD
jgi:molybdopterin molybdotransferase